MRKWILTVLLVVVTGSGAQAAQLEPLMQKLVDKGVLTAAEAQEITVETKEQVKKDIAAGKSEILPNWIQNTKLKGDFRARYQYDHAKATLNDRHRARVRVRLGLESKVNDKINVGVGLATGSTDATSHDAARSTNQTLGDGNAKKAVTLDYAYIKYSPLNFLDISAGKMKNPLWEPGDLIWDTDINPEGGALSFNKKINSKLDSFATFMAVVLDESGSAGENDDPMLYVLQKGVNLKVTETVNLKGAISYYDFANVKLRKLDGTVNSNSRLSGDRLRYGYRVFSPTAELTITEPLKVLNIGFLNIPSLSFFGEYLNNCSVDDEGSGYMLGLKFGAAKIAAANDWQVKYNFARLERDAIADILPDSDRYGGKCGTRGHELAIEYGLGKNTSIAVDIYRAQVLGRNSLKQPATLVQVDFNFKF